MAVQVVVLCFILLFIFIVFLKKGKYTNLPPGPPGIPIFGNYLQIGDKHILEELTKYRQTYGDIFKLQIGSLLIIVLNGYDTIKEVFLRRGDEFYNRPHNFSNVHVLEHHGILSKNHQSWKEQRAFVVSKLRHFGIGRKSIEIPIREECECVVHEVKKQNDKSFDMKHLIENATANVICNILFNQRYEYDDKIFHEMSALILQFAELLYTFNGINAFPYMRFFPGDLLGHQKFIDCYQKFITYLNARVSEHKKTLDITEPRDLIDFYLLEIKRNKGNENSSFTEYQLLHILADFYIGGIETLTNTLCWAFINLIHYPDMQKKLHKEIEMVLGSAAPCMENKKDMPYMAAFLEEVQRISTVAPLSFEHAPNNDTTIGGYFIPKDAILIPNLYSLAFDPAVFPNPKEFSPERFLDKEGNFHPAEKIFPFSLGPRVCVGESLAKTEIFIFLTSILQRFNILEGDEGKPSREPVISGSCTPRPFTMKATPRG